VSELAHGVAQTPHAYMVEAIAEKVARDEKQRQFIESGNAAATEFKRTGVAYSHKEAMRYARARAKGRKARRPQPIRVPAAER
jgi:predicted transcriptional regulator